MARLATFLASSLALFGQPLVCAQACNRDNCFRDVFGSNPPSDPRAGSLACSQFMTQRVNPCPETVLSTITDTVPGSPVTVTQTVSTSVVSTSTSVSTAQSTSVVTDIITQVTFETVTFTSISVSTVSSSVTVTSVQGSNNFKRERISDAVAHDERRAIAPANCPTTSSATSVPSQYSAKCSNASRFSSVCRCNGITAVVQTSTASTVTSVTAVTATQTPTVYVTTTITSTVGSIIPDVTTLVQTSTVQTTFVTTSTQTETRFSVSTVSVTATSTVLLPPFPTTFIIQAGTAPGVYGVLRDDQYLRANEKAITPAILAVPKSTAQYWRIVNNVLQVVDGSAQAYGPTYGGAIDILSPSDTANQKFYQVMSASMGAYDSSANGFALTFANPGDGGPFFQRDESNNLFFNFRADIPGYSPVPPLFAVAP